MTRAGADGVPLLERLPHRMLLKRVALLDEGGDHVCLSAECLDAETPGRFKPLRLSQCHPSGAGPRERRARGPADGLTQRAALIRSYAAWSNATRRASSTWVGVVDSVSTAAATASCFGQP